MGGCESTSTHAVAAVLRQSEADCMACDLRVEMMNDSASTLSDMHYCSSAVIEHNAAEMQRMRIHMLSLMLTDAAPTCLRTQQCAPLDIVPTQPDAFAAWKAVASADVAAQFKDGASSAQLGEVADTLHDALAESTHASRTPAVSACLDASTAARSSVDAMWTSHFAHVAAGARALTKAAQNCK